MSGFCHFGLVLFMVLWQSPDTPVMSGFHVSVRLRVCSSRALSRLRAFFHVERGVRIPALMSWVSVTWRGLDTHTPRSVSLCECACISCYILCCVARSLYIHWLRAFMLSCLVWTCGLWVFSSAACSCPVLHMAGDLFAGHVLVFLFCVSTWLLS